MPASFPGSPPQVGGLPTNPGVDMHCSNGDMIEVEPDVILVAYPESMGEIRPSYIRAQRIRITPEGPVPVAF